MYTPIFPISLRNSASDITKLPFVKAADNGIDYCCWHVRPTGHYLDECLLGEAYARELIAYVTQHKNHDFLGWVISDMGKCHKQSGLEIGFTSYISEVLIQLMQYHFALRLPQASFSTGTS